MVQERDTRIYETIRDYYMNPNTPSSPPRPSNNRISGVVGGVRIDHFLKIIRAVYRRGGWEQTTYANAIRYLNEQIGEEVWNSRRSGARSESHQVRCDFIIDHYRRNGTMIKSSDKTKVGGTRIGQFVCILREVYHKGGWEQTSYADSIRYLNEQIGEDGWYPIHRHNNYREQCEYIIDWYRHNNRNLQNE